MILIYLIANFLFNIYFDSESLSKVDVDGEEKISVELTQVER